MLSEWGSGSNDIKVIATVQKRDLDRLRASRGVHHEQLRDVLAVAVQHDAVVTVPNVHTGEEWERIRRLYPDEEVEGCLGDHLFRADKILERFCDARGTAAVTGRGLPRRPRCEKGWASPSMSVGTTPGRCSTRRRRPGRPGPYRARQVIVD
jgi:hypothetical protein